MVFGVSGRVLQTDCKFIKAQEAVAFEQSPSSLGRGSLPVGVYRE